VHTSIRLGAGRLYLVGGVLFLLFFAAAQVGGADVPVEVNKVWDAGAHNAFTDLERFKGRAVLRVP
jgi:hypothetical protein